MPKESASKDSKMQNSEYWKANNGGIWSRIDFEDSAKTTPGKLYDHQQSTILSQVVLPDRG
jgi:hypothetical protein